MIPAPPHLQLAQKHYVVRVQELRELIAAEETKFQSVPSSARRPGPPLTSLFPQDACQGD